MGWVLLKCILVFVLRVVVLAVCLPVGIVLGILGVVAFSAAAGRK
jgi:hypothetical protein